MLLLVRVCMCVYVFVYVRRVMRLVPSVRVCACAWLESAQLSLRVERRVVARMRGGGPASAARQQRGEIAAHVGARVRACARSLRRGKMGRRPSA